MHSTKVLSNTSWKLKHNLKWQIQKDNQLSNDISSVLLLFLYCNLSTPFFILSSVLLRSFVD